MESFDRTLVDRAKKFPLARHLAFQVFKNRYAGRGCYVVGRGPTRFDYGQLADVSDPIFFINDAVGLEKITRAETFFFAHDPQMNVWLDGEIRSTAVLPVGGKIACDDVVRKHAGAMVWYRWREPSLPEILRLGRDEIAEVKELFLNTGTIHPLIHFLWFCGFARVRYVGCDCISDPAMLGEMACSTAGYDPRLSNLSGTSTDWRYAQVRRAQDLLNRLFGFEVEYLGTP